MMITKIILITALLSVVALLQALATRYVYVVDSCWVVYLALSLMSARSLSFIEELVEYKARISLLVKTIRQMSNNSDD